MIEFGSVCTLGSNPFSTKIMSVLHNVYICIYTL